MTNINAEGPCLICPLTLEVMDDPVIALDGFTYEKTAIERWFKKRTTSPMTNEVISGITLISDHIIKSYIAIYREKEARTREIKEEEEQEQLKNKKRAFSLFSELKEPQREMVEQWYFELHKSQKCMFNTCKREWDCLNDKAKCEVLKKMKVQDSYVYLTLNFRAFLSFKTQIIRHNLRAEKTKAPSNKIYWNQNSALHTNWIDEFVKDV